MKYKNIGAIYYPSAANFDRHCASKARFIQGDKQWNGYSIEQISRLLDFARGFTLYQNASVIDCSSCWYSEANEAENARYGEWCGANKQWVGDGVLYCDFYKEKDNTDIFNGLGNHDCGKTLASTEIDGQFLINF